MDKLPIGTETVLSPSTLLAIEDQLPQWIGCQQGAIWISQTAEPRDIVLEAGDSIVLEDPRQAIVGAVGGRAVVFTDLDFEAAIAA